MNERPSDFSMFSFTDPLSHNSTTHHSYDLAHTNVYPYNSTTHFCDPNTYYSITPNTITYPISNYNITYPSPSLYPPTNS